MDATTSRRASFGAQRHKSEQGSIDVAQDSGLLGPSVEHKKECDGNFDLNSALEWNNGVASLPGSTLKFRLNEFGTLEMISGAVGVLMDEDGRCHTESNGGRDAGMGEPSSGVGGIAAMATGRKNSTCDPIALPALDEVCCCEQCGRYGTADDFCNGKRFCSETCSQNSFDRLSSQSTGEARLGSDCQRKRGRKLILNARIDPDQSANGSDREEKKGDLKIKLKVPSPTELSIKLRRNSEGSHSCRRKSWSWSSYLDEEKAIAAPSKLFKEFQVVPQIRNGFRVGMRLEGIDPRHQSMFCVLSVAEVCGYRMRLHFDGYSECYDFWLNADSSDIHPASWCEKTGHKLQPPKGYKEDEFTWPTYLKVCKGQAAPRHLFKNYNMTVTPMGFRVGMKLEAVDRRNPALICVASITDIVDNRLLVHFDTWDDSYDYWCDPSSPYIHPVGWCQGHGRMLSLPQTYLEYRTFTWDRYLEETGCQAAPARAFKQRPAHGFQRSMRLEAVDKRNPALIRAAMVSGVEDHRIQIHFDGWSHEYDYWLDADSPDFHPVGWCEKTGHPLQPPANLMDFVMVGVGSGCPTPGCTGVGHIKGAKYTGHHSAFGCPYSELNMNKETTLQDRLGSERTTIGSILRAKHIDNNSASCSGDPGRWVGSQNGCSFQLQQCPTPVEELEGNSVEAAAPTLTNPVPELSRDEPENKCVANVLSEIPPAKNPAVPATRGRRPKLYGRVGRPPKYLKLKKEQELAEQKRAEDVTIEMDESCKRKLPLEPWTKQREAFLNSSLEREERNVQQALHQSVFMSAMSAHPARDLPLYWQQHGKLLPQVSGITASKVTGWNTEEVASFIRTLPGCQEQARMFREQQIDGEALLLLTQTDLVRIMTIKLGPALKIYNSILMFKNADG
uniref:lethal(3)malignant brain tumor-like protein 3 isoform X2 n=2 Tax=Myxine glutinosa TaxID=7769 RepID=UPI00358E93DE